MKLDDRNKIHAAIEEACDRAGLSAETGGGFMRRIGDVEDGGDAWEVPIVVRIPKTRTGVSE